MTLQDAMAAQPMWVVWWTNWLLVGAIVLPLVLLIWQPSRVAGMITALSTVVAGVAITWIYGMMGYVKLLGLPHIIVWVPVVYFLLGQVRREDMPAWPKRIMWVIIATLCVSLAFDIVDVATYLIYKPKPTILPA